MAAKFDVLVASSIKRKDGEIVAGRLNLYGSWVKRVIAANKAADLRFLAPLATLRKLKLTSPNLVLDDKVAEKIVFSGYLHQLEELDGIPRKWLARLALSKKPWALKRVKPFEGSHDDKKERAALDAAFAKGKGLPALTELSLTWSEHGPSAFRWVMTTATGKQLKVLRINCSHFAKPLVEWQRAVDKANIALQEIEMYTGSTTVSLRRDAKGWRLTGDLRQDEAKFYGLGKRELAEALPKLTLQSVEIDGFR